MIVLQTPPYCERIGKWWSNLGAEGEQDPDQVRCLASAALSGTGPCGCDRLPICEEVGDTTSVECAEVVGEVQQAPRDLLPLEENCDIP